MHAHLFVNRATSKLKTILFIFQVINQLGS